MRGVAVEDGAVAVADLAGVVQHDHLGREVRDTRGGLVLGVGGHVASLDVLDGDVLDVEANIVSGDGLGQRLVVHLHGLDLGGQLVGGEGDDHAGLDDAGLHSAHGHCANTSDFVDVLHRAELIFMSNLIAKNKIVPNLIFSELCCLHLKEIRPERCTIIVDMYRKHFSPAEEA